MSCLCFLGHAESGLHEGVGYGCRFHFIPRPSLTSSSLISSCPRPYPRAASVRPLRPAIDTSAFAARQPCAAPRFRGAMPKSDCEFLPIPTLAFPDPAPRAAPW
jgi:hypothetical protein